MAALEEVRLEVREHIARIVMNRPPFNTMTVSFMRKVRELLQEVAASSARVVVWESAVSGMFSMGLDPHEILGTDDVGRKRIFEELFLFAKAALESPLASVAVVEGPAMAGGAVITGLCDEVIMHRDKGKICFSEVKVNLAVPAAIARLVARKVNAAATLDMIALGRNMAAEELCHLGYAALAFQSREEKEGWLKDRAEKWSRLQRDVVGETLRELRLDVRKGFEEFPKGIERFLREPFLPVGVRMVLEKMRP